MPIIDFPNPVKADDFFEVKVSHGLWESSQEIKLLWIQVGRTPQLSVQHAYLPAFLERQTSLAVRSKPCCARACPGKITHSEEEDKWQNS